MVPPLVVFVAVPMVVVEVKLPVASDNWTVNVLPLPNVQEFVRLLVILKVAPAH
jgi:hypothetical protein